MADGLVEALVEYEYIAEHEDELTIKPGDIITHVEKQDGGWWKGKLNGKVGVFPDNFVKEIKPFIPAPPNPKPNVPEPEPSIKRQGNNVGRKKLRAKVTYSYAPQNEDELELKVGDIVEIENKEEEGWWEGTSKDKRGVFPSNFVDLIEDDTAAASEPSAAAEGDTQGEDFKEIKGKKPKGFGFGNIFASAAGAEALQRVKKSKSQDEELKSEPKHIQHGRKSASVRETTKEPPTLPHRDRPSVAKQPPAPPPKVRAGVVTSGANQSNASDETKAEKAKVLYPYAAENEDELTLETGQIITILDKNLEDSGWWKGEVHGKVGVFPDNFVDLLPLETAPTPKPLSSVTKNKSKSPPTVEPSKPHGKEGATSTPSSVASAAMKIEAKSDAHGGVPKKPGPPLLKKKPSAKPADPKLLTLTDDHKVQEQKTGLYIDTAEPNPPLQHPNKTRPKGPAKRLPGTKPNNDASLEREEEEMLPGRAFSHRRVAPQPPASALHKGPSLHGPVFSKKESSPEPELPNGTAHVPERPAKLDNHSPTHRPEKPVYSHTDGHAGSDSHAEVAELRKHVEALRNDTVPRKQFDHLQKQVHTLQATMEEMQKSFDKKLCDLMFELDEEKKLRQSAIIDMERIKKSFAPK